MFFNKELANLYRGTEAAFRFSITQRRSVIQSNGVELWTAFNNICGDFELFYLSNGIIGEIFADSEHWQHTVCVSGINLFINTLASSRNTEK